MTNNTEVAEMFPRQLLINGRWVNSSSGKSFDVINPANLTAIAKVADAGASEALDALSAAWDAQPSMSATTPQQRSDFLNDLYAATLANAKELASVMTKESGKPMRESIAEVHYGADYLRWFAAQALRIPGQTRRAPAGHTITVTFKPVGPAYLITPWNFPLAMITRKLAPAIAAGCATIIKPASATPLTTLYFAHLAMGLVEKHGIPSGAINVVPSSDSGAITDAIIGDPRLRKLSFTGSTEVGAELLGKAAPNILRTSMELGGNAPFIVCADADLDAAVEGAVAAKMRNAGQTCVAANRFIVARSVATEFTRKLRSAFEKLVVAPGEQQDSTVGPLISPSAVKRVTALVNASRAHGATIAYEHSAIPRADAYYPPTILITDASDPIFSEEIFGPVAPVVTFDSVDEAIRIANDTPFGLVGYAYTNDLGTAEKIKSTLEVGMLGLNRGMVSDATAPFGGVKHSGVGREGGYEGLLEYLEPMYVAS